MHIINSNFHATTITAQETALVSTFNLILDTALYKPLLKSGVVGTNSIVTPSYSQEYGFNWHISLTAFTKQDTPTRQVCFKILTFWGIFLRFLLFCRYLHSAMFGIHISGFLSFLTIIFITFWEIKDYLKMAKERKILSYIRIFIPRFDIYLDIQVSLK